MKITNDVTYIGVNDHEIDLFEGQYDVPNGMAYNSYLITDEKIAVMDTVDQRFTHEWLDNLDKALDGKRGELEGVVLGVNQRIVALHMAGNDAHGLAAGQVLDLEHMAPLDGSLGIVASQQIDVSHQAFGLQVRDCLPSLLGIDKRDKAINSFHILFNDYFLDAQDVLEILDYLDYLLKKLRTDCIKWLR